MPFVLQVQGQLGLPSEFQASQRDIGRLFSKNQKTNIQPSQWGKKITQIRAATKPKPIYMYF